MATLSGTQIVKSGLIFYLDDANSKFSISSLTYINVMDSTNLVSVNNGLEKGVAPTYQPYGPEYNYLLSQTSASFSYVSTKNANETSLIQNIFTDVTGESDPCSGLLTFEQALQWAHSLGGRLPTRQEIADGVVKGTGCGYDTSYIWTCDNWNGDDNYHWVDYGDQLQGVPGLTFANDSLANVRMVADRDRDRTDPVILNDSVIYNYLVSNYTDSNYVYQTYKQGYIDTFNFDGVDDYIGLGKSFIDEIGTGDVAYTLEAWINYNGTPGSDFHGYSIIGSAGSYGIGLQLFQYSLGVKLNFGYRSNSNVYSNSYLQPETWYHVVGTRDIGGSINIYINGQLDYSTSGNLTVTYTDSEMQIGYSAGRISNFSGRISMPKIYNRSLSSEEVYTNYSSSMWRFIDFLP